MLLWLQIALNRSLRIFLLKGRFEMQVPGAQVPGARCQVPSIRCAGFRYQVHRFQVSGSRYQMHRFQVPGARYQVRRFQVSGANFKIPETCKSLKLAELISNDPLTNIYVGNLQYQYPSLQISIFVF